MSKGSRNAKYYKFNENGHFKKNSLKLNTGKFKSESSSNKVVAVVYETFDEGTMVRYWQ